MPQRRMRREHNKACQRNHQDECSSESHQSHKHHTLREDINALKARVDALEKRAQNVREEG